MLLHADGVAMLSRFVFSVTLGVFATCAVTACIFDSGGDYTGGGRRDIGASLNQGQEEPEPEEDGGGAGSSSGGQDSGNNPLADAFGGGGG